jgi:hypothetical protein
MQHMKANLEVNFVIAEEVMEFLKNVGKLRIMENTANFRYSRK